MGCKKKLNSTFFKHSDWEEHSSNWEGLLKRRTNFLIKVFLTQTRKINVNSPKNVVRRVLTCSFLRGIILKPLKRMSGTTCFGVVIGFLICFGNKLNIHPLLVAKSSTSRHPILRVFRNLWFIWGSIFAWPKYLQKVPRAKYSPLHCTSHANPSWTWSFCMAPVQSPWSSIMDIKSTSLACSQSAPWHAQMGQCRFILKHAIPMVEACQIHSSGNNLAMCEFKSLTS